jgi:hypothetical protein
MLSAPEAIAARHEVGAFSCGKPALDDWLKTRAFANQRNGFAVVMVVHDENRVAGFYALAPTAVLPARCRGRYGPGNPPTLWLVCGSGSSRPIFDGRGRAWELRSWRMLCGEACVRRSW